MLIVFAVLTLIINSAYLDVQFATGLHNSLYRLSARARHSDSARQSHPHRSACVSVVGLNAAAPAERPGSAAIFAYRSIVGSHPTLICLIDRLCSPICPLAVIAFQFQLFTFASLIRRITLPDSVCSLSMNEYSLSVQCRFDLSFICLTRSFLTLMAFIFYAGSATKAKPSCPPGPSESSAISLAVYSLHTDIQRIVQWANAISALHTFTH